MKNNYNINSLKSIWAMCLMPVVGGSTFIVQPGFLQGLVSYSGFSIKDAGFILSIEMTGFAIGTILMAIFSSKVNWRRMMRGCMFVTVVLTFLCMFIEGLYAFFTLRFVIGLVTGIIVSLGFTSLGLTNKVERNYGFSICLGMIYGAAVLYLLPTLFELWGLNALLTMIIMFCIIGLVFSGHLPEGGTEQKVIEDYSVDLSLKLKRVGVFSVFLYFLAQGAVWGYIFVFGTDAGLSEKTVSFHLTLSQFTAILGALVAVFVGARYTRLLPLLLGVLAGVIPLVMYLYMDVSAQTFLIGILIYNFGFNLTHPYLLATMASFDKKGQMVVYAVCAQTLGLAFGPAVGALLITENGYDNIKLFSIIFFLSSFVFVSIPLYKQRQIIKKYG